jgi:signal transduction histidine kinase
VLVPVHARGRVAVRDELPHAWRRELAGSDRPRVLAAGAAGSALDPETASALLLPVRRAGELALVVALGPKQSGDVFTAHDRALLAELAARVAAVLERLAHGELLEAAQRLNEELLHDREELTREREVLGRASEAKSTLLASAGHDLRQPLHAMELFLAALEERVDDETSRALLLRARSSARSLEQTFDGLLDAARLDAGVLRPEQCDLALAPLFAELERDARPIAEARGLVLRVRPSELAVHSDPLLLRSVLQNLLGNALRYTVKGGVLVGARRRGGEVRIEVWDTGPGIAPDEQERLFRAWERGAASRSAGEGRSGDPRASRGREGSGLGLALATRMSEVLGHRLELRSWPARGSVFSVSAPSAHARSGGAKVRPETRRLVRPGGARPVVALLEDDSDALAGLEALLSAWGADVLPATSTGALLGALATAPRRPDALITDLHLGAGASGLDAIVQVRAALAEPVPAIVVSADRSAEAEARVRATGHLLLRKPVEPARLRAALAHLLG